MIAFPTATIYRNCLNFCWCYFLVWVLILSSPSPLSSLWNVNSGPFQFFFKVEILYLNYMCSFYIKNANSLSCLQKIIFDQFWYFHFLVPFLPFSYIVYILTYRLISSLILTEQLYLTAFVQMYSFSSYLFTCSH